MKSPLLSNQSIPTDVRWGQDVPIFDFVNPDGGGIGDESKIGTFGEIQEGVRIGRRGKISGHTFICEGVIIEDEALVGRSVMFTSDECRRTTTARAERQTAADWPCVPRRASIGAGATIQWDMTIGERAMVGAGAVVTRDVLRGSVIASNPANTLRTA